MRLLRSDSQWSDLLWCAIPDCCYLRFSVFEWYLCRVCLCVVVVLLMVARTDLWSRDWSCHLFEHPVSSTMVQGHLENFTRNIRMFFVFFQVFFLFLFIVPSTFLSGVSLTVFLFSFPFLFLILLGTWFCSL